MYLKTGESCHKVVFDSFWNKAIPAEQRTREIEEELFHSYSSLFRIQRSIKKGIWYDKKWYKRNTKNVSYSKWISFAGTKLHIATFKRDGKAKYRIKDNNPHSYR